MSDHIASSGNSRSTYWKALDSNKGGVCEQLPICPFQIKPIWYLLSLIGRSRPSLLDHKLIPCFYSSRQLAFPTWFHRLNTIYPNVLSNAALYRKVGYALSIFSRFRLPSKEGICQENQLRPMTPKYDSSQHGRYVGRLNDALYKQNCKNVVSQDLMEVARAAFWNNLLKKRRRVVILLQKLVWQIFVPARAALGQIPNFQQQHYLNAKS